MDSLTKNKYIYIKNMLSVDLIEYLSTWHLKNYKKTMKDDQVPLAFSKHSSDSEIYSHLLYHLLPIMEKETNLKLKPMYSYSRLYLGGAELKKHLDREACEISASITLKYFYADKTYQWPLCMGNTPINIKSGDGVIYKGCEIEHWRPIFQQPKKYWHHQVFVHYVDLNGPYADEKEEVYE
jgi:hypothetical protein|tara:strand:+ start:3155 stop:3697 length:543 start_codon:yes stop_codon:yes gene_type:complete